VSKYKLYRRKKTLKGVVSYRKQPPYVFNPAYRRAKGIIDVSKLSVYNSKMIDNILERKYIRRYKNLLKLLYLLFNDQFPGESGFPIVLDESDRLRAILLNKYHKYLSAHKEAKFLKELDYIDSEVKMKYLEYKMFSNDYMSYNDYRR